MAGPGPAILAVAPNGARRTKRDHPALPIAPEELADEAAACLAAGASLLHLHVRDAEGGHSLDPERYRDALDAIGERIGDALILQITSEAAGIYGPEEQMAAVDAVEPEAVSLAVRELFAPVAGEARAGRFCHRLAERGCLVQYILYSADDAARLGGLVARGLVPSRCASLLFVIGSYRAPDSDPADLPLLLGARSDALERLPWFVCAFGPAEFDCAAAALESGGHPRVGFENNLLDAEGRPATGNAAQLAPVAAAAAQAGRPLADAAAARRILSAV